MESNAKINAAAYDVVIPYGPNEQETIVACVGGIQKFLPYRKIYLIAFEPIQLPQCITILEDRYAFKIADVARLHGKNPRNGWYLQQLLKLYFPTVVPDVSENFLVVDADTVFRQRPPSFFDGNQIYFNFSDESHPPYFQHMALLHPSLVRAFSDKSGICHLMPFTRRYVKELFDLVEGFRGKQFPFWKLFLEAVDPRYYESSGASEYEIYFSFMAKFHPEVFQLRQLSWANVGSLSEAAGDFDYVSCHWYRRSNNH